MPSTASAHPAIDTTLNARRVKAKTKMDNQSGTDLRQEESVLHLEPSEICSKPLVSPPNSRCNLRRLWDDMPASFHDRCNSIKQFLNCVSLLCHRACLEIGAQFE